MAVGGVVVVVGTVQVRRHDADVVGAVLAVEVLAVFQAGDLGQGVGLVGLFQRRGQQAAFRHGLGRQAGINAGAAQKFQLFAAVLPGRVDDVHLQNHVVVHEIGLGLVVGHDAAHLGRGQKDVFRLFGGEEGFHRVLAAEVQLFVGAGDDVLVALALQLPHDGRAHHAAVAGHIDLCVFVHHITSPHLSPGIPPGCRRCAPRRARRRPCACRAPP